MHSMKVFLSMILLGVSTGALWAAESSQDIIDKMIDAHGGYKKWAKAPTVSFDDSWLKAGETKAGDSSVTVHQKTRQAYLHFHESDTHVSWDGEKAWHVGDPLPFPPRFVALLNYHFANLPWLAKDPGVVLSDPSTGKIYGKGKDHIKIKITYEANVGDTPKDYYDLYIDPDSYELKGLEYIVTYKAILPEGQNSTPPNMLIYDEWTEVNGLKVPTKYTTYMAADKPYYYVTVKNWDFSKPFDQSKMTMPENGVVDESLSGL